MKHVTFKALFGILLSLNLFWTVPAQALKGGGSHTHGGGVHSVLDYPRIQSLIGEYSDYYKECQSDELNFVLFRGDVFNTRSSGVTERAEYDGINLLLSPLGQEDLYLTYLEVLTHRVYSDSASSIINQYRSCLLQFESF